MKWLKSIALLMAVLSCVATAQADVAGEVADDLAERIGNGDPVLGKAKAGVQGCLSCHQTEVSGSPKLSGQYVDYLLKQLQSFDAGTRKHSAEARKLKEGDGLADIAAYFASQPLMKGAAVADSPSASLLFTKGDRSRDILPCVSCHGPKGKGSIAGSDSFPVIGGQQKQYLQEQLIEFRKGSRSGSAGGIMNIITKSLSDSEIEALSNYISGL